MKIVKVINNVTKFSDSIWRVHFFRDVILEQQYYL